MPGRPLVSYLECAGNHWAMFDLVQGRPAQGTQWMTGAVGNAEWTGVALRDVLTQAGIRENAASVLVVGLDTDAPEESFRRVLPVAKSVPPDTLLAYAMNGDVLPPDHGFPLRAVVLGWVGSSSIKWLGQIQVSTEPPLDAQQLDVLCADRRRLPRRGRSSRSRGDDPDHQERVGIVLARGPFGRSA